MKLKTLQHGYMRWLRKTISGKPHNPWLRHNENMQRIQKVRQLQAENYEYEKQRLEMRQEELLKKMEDKRMLAKVGVEVSIKKRKEGIASMNKNKAALIYGGMVKK